jgi:dTDP-4-dehydrorhamnose 3,5-epimerase-like enzyme
MINSIVPSGTGPKGIISVINLNLIGDFTVKRVYTITNESVGSVRGHHAHKNLKQLFFCSHGIIKLQLFDGISWTEVILDSPNKFFFVDAMIWRTMEWLVENSVLTVLASEEYDESDYIRDFNAFCLMATNQ